MRKNLYSVHFAFANSHYVLNKKAAQLDVWKAFTKLYLENPECPPMKFITWKDEARLSRYDGLPIIHDVVTSTKAHMRRLMELFHIKPSKRNDADLKDFTLQWDESWNDPAKRPWKEHPQKMRMLKAERSREPESEGDTLTPHTSINRRGFKSSFDDLKTRAIKAMPVSYNKLFNEILAGAGGNRRQDVINTLLESSQIEEFSKDRSKHYRLKKVREQPKPAPDFELQQAQTCDSAPNYPQISPEYAKPSPQPALHGEMGLSSKDLAKSLGVFHKNILAKIRRLNESVKWVGLGFRLAAYEADEYSLNTDLAKAFVAKWDNENGWGYMRYLLDCEKVVESKQQPLLSEAQISQIVAMTNVVMAKMLPKEVESTTTTIIEKTVTPKVTENKERHLASSLNPTQQDLLDAKVALRVKEFRCSKVDGIIGRHIKSIIRPNSCHTKFTRYQIKQQDFHRAINLVEDWQPTQLDVKSIQKWWKTEAGMRDRKKWGLV